MQFDWGTGLVVCDLALRSTWFLNYCCALDAVWMKWVGGLRLGALLDLVLGLLLCCCVAMDSGAECGCRVLPVYSIVVVLLSNGKSRELVGTCGTIFVPQSNGSLWTTTIQGADYDRRRKDSGCN
jgi:hypothetical protein